jgi:hypothetical protein
MDFTGVLRCIAGPLLIGDGTDGRVRLPVISSSSVKRSKKTALFPFTIKYAVHQQERDFCERLEIISDIARTAICFPCIKVEVTRSTLSVSCTRYV